jgi:hypothetical protein
MRLEGVKRQINRRAGPDFAQESGNGQQQGDFEVLRDSRKLPVATVG